MGGFSSLKYMENSKIKATVPRGKIVLLRPGVNIGDNNNTRLVVHRIIIKLHFRHDFPTQTRISVSIIVLCIALSDGGGGGRGVGVVVELMQCCGGRVGYGGGDGMGYWRGCWGGGGGGDIGGC